MEREDDHQHDQERDDPRGIVVKRPGREIWPAFQRAPLAPLLRAEQIPDASDAGQPEKIDHFEPLSFRTPNIVGLKRGFKSIAGGDYAL